MPDSSLGLIDRLFEEVQDLEKHPGWENALETVHEDFIGWNFDLFELMLKKISSMPQPLRHKVIQKGWDALPPFEFEFHHEEETLVELIKLLKESGADLDSREKDGSTLLQRLASAGYQGSCCFLISRGAAINTCATPKYGTPLQEAIKHSDVKVADLLLEHKIDVNALPADKQGITALQAASINGMFEMAVRLLKKGADVSAPAAPYEGRTAIDGAAERGHLDMVQLLLNAHGEEVEIGPVCNQAAGYAEKEGHYEIGQWLRGNSHV